MALQKDVFLYLIIVTSLIISCYTNTTLHYDGPFPIEEEFGNDFQAYPNSYLTTNVEDIKFEEEEGILALARVISVDDFGAKGDGKDDSQAFGKAWNEACSSSGAVLLLVPQKTYLLKPVTFSGPCNSNLTMQISGTIEASNDRNDYSRDGKHWIIFEGVDNLMVGGGGIIDGNGRIWWQNSCKINKTKPCKDAPTALTFLNSKNIVLKNLKIQNAQQIHVAFQKCLNVRATNLVVTAPENSPNTDGIHVTATQNIYISSCIIQTGDDCISIVSGSQNVQAMDITCGPGHGISIGSLGSGNSEAHVSDVLVSGVRLTGTTNGVRIKTWQGGFGSASNIKFQNVVMNNVTNPILIDQNYCDQTTPCNQQKSAVQVRNVVYQNIKGTSASKIAIKLDCSKNYPCQGVVLQNVNLYQNGPAKATAFCNNAKFSESGFVSPSCP